MKKYIMQELTFRLFALQKDLMLKIHEQVMVGKM